MSRYNIVLWIVLEIHLMWTTSTQHFSVEVSTSNYMEGWDNLFQTHNI